MGSPSEQEFIGNGFRIEKGAEVEQFQGCGTLLSDALAGQPKRCGHGVGMVAADDASSSEQALALLLITVLVARDAASGLLDIGSSLIKCQGQPSHDRDELR